MLREGVSNMISARTVHIANYSAVWNDVPCMAAMLNMRGYTPLLVRIQASSAVANCGVTGSNHSGKTLNTSV